MYILLLETDNCPSLNKRKGENDHRKYFMINLHERMLPTSAGVEPATSWSPVGQRIQLSHERLAVKWSSDLTEESISTNSRYILIRYIYSAVVHYKYAFALNAKSGTGKPNSTFLTFIIFLLSLKFVEKWRAHPMVISIT